MTTVMFLHIPKTGGTSFHEVLGAAYGDAYYRIDNIRNRDPIYGWKPSTMPDHIQALSGHVEWGIHKHLRGPVRYITVVRHPVSRLLSLYTYVREKNSHPLKAEAMLMKFEEWVLRNQPACFDNEMTRVLCGKWDHGIAESRGEVTLTDFREAAANMLQCWSVGVTNHLPHFVQDVAKSCDWKLIPPLPHRLAQPKRMRVKDLSRSVVDAVERKNKYDMALWSMAKRLHPLQPRIEIG